jgi:hypothetical protein
MQNSKTLNLFLRPRKEGLRMAERGKWGSPSSERVLKLICRPFSSLLSSEWQLTIYTLATSLSLIMSNITHKDSRTISDQKPSRGLGVDPGTPPGTAPRVRGRVPTHEITARKAQIDYHSSSTSSLPSFATIIYLLAIESALLLI